MNRRDLVRLGITASAVPLGLSMLSRAGTAAGSVALPAINLASDGRGLTPAEYTTLLQNRLEETGRMVKSQIGYHLKSETVKQSEEQIFSWLELQDMNVVVIIILMVVVAGFSMISALLILILEKTSMIGILKALGANNYSIDHIFFYNAVYIISIGLFFGNLIGIGLCLLQSYFSLIPLSVESYYVSTVPIDLSWILILDLNIATFALCIMWVMIASGVISHITPVKAIQYK